MTDSGISQPKNNPLWDTILDDVQIVMTSLGFVANVVTFVVLRRGKNDFGATSILLLRCQAMVDAVVCLTSILLLALPPVWVVGDHNFDVFICHFWHSQFFYWLAVTCSIYNIMLIAVDRYLAICTPFKHRFFGLRRVRFAILVSYLIALVNDSPSLLQVRFADGRCVSEFPVDGDQMKQFFAIYGCYAWIAVYVLPCLFLILTYGRVIYIFQTRVGESSMPRSAVVDKVAKDLTLTAIVVSAIFIVAIGYDLTYYFLGYVGVVEYRLNEPIQKIGILLSALNSVANPFVYVLVLPAFRRTLLSSFCSRRSGPTRTSRTNTSVTVQSQTDSGATRVSSSSMGDINIEDDDVNVINTISRDLDCSTPV